jgi:predicted nucleic acid-binding protein
MPGEAERVDVVISVDAGIWLAYLRGLASAERLRQLLDEDRLSVHPFVLIQLRLALRGPSRRQILPDVERLVTSSVDAPAAVSAFIEEHDLGAFELDVVGAHLLTSAQRNGDQLWTVDRDLRAAATELKLAFEPSR